jgi:hypothetical protein
VSLSGEASMAASGITSSQRQLRSTATGRLLFLEEEEAQLAEDDESSGGLQSVDGPDTATHQQNTGPCGFGPYMDM